MNQRDIIRYIDPDEFDGTRENTYPCNTQFMEYKSLVSRYFLTNQALEEYGINTNLLCGANSPKAATQFIEEVSDDLYDVIARLAPYNFQYNCWLVAKSRSLNFPNRYACRKQFEKALIYQAQYKLKNIDVRDINGIDLDGGQSIYHKQLRKELRHISPKALDILQALGLLFNGNIPGKHLVNYAEEM